MHTRLLLPLVAISALALAACEGNSPPPATTEPDASIEGEAMTQAEPVEQPADTEAETAENLGTDADIQQTIDSIEQQAAETFDSILEQTEQSTDQAADMGTNAMERINEEFAAMGSQVSETLDERIDAIISGVASFSSDNLSDEQRIQVVASARTAAESAARNLGRDEAEIVAAGDTAEERAREVMGL
ncbi:hypothetical protein [Pelagibacterium montanilacus]|uniref:hypothetical protein n=1 Tax=Pelagibacterium montanilacus TaxID=2185280 RepID=UPI000F8F3356|nr:hypothetical protein [Pelagibacterium montanilacus]